MEIELTQEFIDSIPEEEWHGPDEKIDWDLKHTVEKNDMGKIIRVEFKHIDREVKYLYGYITSTGNSWVPMEGCFRAQMNKYCNTSFVKKTQRDYCNPASTRAVNITKNVRFIPPRKNNP
jgi:hypothetical protein